MIVLVISALIIGIVLGYLGYIPLSIIENIDLLINVSLMLLLFLVGYESASNKKIMKDMKKYGLRILLVPLGVMLGSILFSGFAVLFFDIKLLESFAVGAGVGYYSLSSIIITQTINAEIGIIAFLTNIIRETLTILFTPIMSKYDKLFPVASAGATSMDTSLGVIREFTDAETALIAVISGIILTIMVPLIVTFITYLA